jgi:hypothetical protein
MELVRHIQDISSFQDTAFLHQLILVTTNHTVSKHISPPKEKRPDSKADHPPPSTAEAKNGWSYDSTTLCVFVACSGIFFRLLRQNIQMHYLPH